MSDHSTTDPAATLASIGLVARDQDCPSELLLDRLHLGELDDEQTARQRQHIEGCAECEAKMAERAQGWAAFEGVDVDAMVARIHVATAGEGAEATPSKGLLDALFGWLRQPVVLAGAGALGAAALALFILRPDAVAPTSDPGGTRFKGGPALNVQVQRATGDAGVTAVSGDTFRAGDTLQFTVDLPEDSHVLVVGVEADGTTTYVAWPLEAARSVARHAGAAQPLEGAVELDDATGSEWLHVVACEAPFEAASVAAGPSSGSLALPEGCRSAPFELKKAGAESQL